ncbi:MAG: 3'-5' exoribonuclease YhaM family protein [Bdellovibrionales bacterium]
MKSFVKDLKERDHFQSVFLVAEKNLGADRNGKAFLSLTLGDASGSINGRLFERAEDLAKTFDVGDAVWVKGFVQVFQNRKQVIVNDMRKAAEGEVQMTELVAELGGDPRQQLDELMQMVSQLDNDMVRELLTRTLTEESTQALLLRAPAAKTIHHAYRGGLIEHIGSIARLMVDLTKHYPFLDKNLLIFGAIYHDLGKIHELDLTNGIHYTQSGRLVGHMAIACEMIDRLTGQIPNFPDDLKDVLKHIVLAHHGRLEYGSPKLPMLAEAMVVAMIDDLDSKLNTLFTFLKAETDSVPPEEKWTHFHSGFERYFYLDFFRKRMATLK